MIKEKIAEIVEERIRICEETGDNWDYGIERLASVNPNNYNQQTFKAAFMRKYIDFNEYVKDIAMEIDYAEGKIDE